MANKIMTDRQFDIKSADTFIIGDVGPSGGSWSIQLDSILFNGTIKVKGRAKGATNFFLVPYTKKWLNQAAGDDTKVTTSITDTSIISIEVAGEFDIALECSAYSSGTMRVTAQPAANSH